MRHDTKHSSAACRGSTVLHVLRLHAAGLDQQSEWVRHEKEKVATPGEYFAAFVSAMRWDMSVGWVLVIWMVIMDPKLKNHQQHAITSATFATREACEAMGRAIQAKAGSRYRSVEFVCRHNEIATE